MNARWQIRDLIDLEYFFHVDESIDDDESACKNRDQRDRTIYLNTIEPELQKQKPSVQEQRKIIIKKWLEGRKSIEKEASGKEAVFPGDSFHQAYLLVFYLFVLGGVVIGGSLGFSFLLYQGGNPVNVSAYFGVFVLSQIILIFILIGYIVFHSRIGSLGRFSVSQYLSGRLLTKMAIKLKESSQHQLTAEQRTGIRAAMGIFKAKRLEYGAVFYWPVFILIQVLGIGFNVGVLSATLVRILGADLAFGWQSTIQLSARAVHEIVTVVSLPWAGIVPADLSHPTLKQIEGSRMVLKEGIGHLVTSDLVSWWPFLCFAVLFYGLLPRTAMLIVGTVMQGRAVKKLDFDGISCDRLMLRLTNPFLDTKGRSGGEAHSGTFSIEPAVESDVVDFKAGPVSQNSVIALIPDEIAEKCSDEALQPLLIKKLGMNLSQSISISFDLTEDKEILMTLPQKKYGNNRPFIFVLQEAWQPPIRETILYFKHLRTVVGDKGKICIGLIGKSREDTIFTPAKKGNKRVWQKEISALGDSGVFILNLGGDDGK